MYLNKYDNHLSYITDISKYSKSSACRKCRKLWKSGRQLTRHETTCQATGTTSHYPGGFYSNPTTVFDQLEDEGFKIHEELRYFPYRAVYDFECLLDKSLASQPSEKLAWDGQHVPVSISVCSNVPGYENPACYISNGDPQMLANRMMDQLLEISQRSYSLLQIRYQPILKQLDQQIQTLTQQEETSKEEDTGKKQRVYLKGLKCRLESYMKELPVLGFNSGKYDINIIKPYLYKHLQEHDKIGFCGQTQH